MLTGYQCEVVAFVSDGGFICYDCAHKSLDRGMLERSELGLGSISPVIRYSLDEYNAEVVYEAARENLEERGIDPSDWKALDDEVEKLGDQFKEVCGECGEVIA